MLQLVQNATDSDSIATNISIQTNEAIECYFEFTENL